MVDNKNWLGKKVYIKLKSSSWNYLGRVVDETDNNITIIDVNGKRVMVSFDAIEIIKEDSKSYE